MPFGLTALPVACCLSGRLFSLTFLSLNFLFWWCHVLSIRFALVISSESWQPLLLTALEPETWHTFLSWQTSFPTLLAFLSLHFPIIFISLVFSRPSLSVLYSSQPSLPHSLHFLSASLSLGISFSWDLLLFSSLHISFSWRDFRLAPFFFFPVASLLHTFILGPLSVKLFHLTPSVLTSPLSWSHVSFSHISFFWHFRTLQTKINPVNYKTCTKSFLYHKPAQSISQYYFVLQSLHKRFPSTTTSYYKACTKDSPVLLRTTKLAQKIPQYYFVVQTKLAQKIPQYYYFILQSLHKVLPSTTSYYKACTKYFPVLLRTTKLAQ